VQFARSAPLRPPLLGSYYYLFVSTMEPLLSPCAPRLLVLLTEHQDRYEDFEENGVFELLQELNLDVSTEEFLSAERGFTYSDLYAMLGNEDTVAWLTPRAAVMREGAISDRVEYALGLEELDDESCHFSFKADGKDMFALARSSEALSEMFDVVRRLLLANASEVYKLELRSVDLSGFFNAPTLAYLLEQCQSLKFLSLSLLEMDENHCRVLGAYSRLDLEIELIQCKLASAGTSALAEVLGRNQGPTKLKRCDIDNSILADGLRGNSRLKSLQPFLTNNVVASQQLLAIAGALRENKGLVDLKLSVGMYGRLRADQTWWDAICDSLETHPTLEVLNLSTYGDDMMAPAVVTSRIQALLDMMKLNTSIHTIRLPDTVRLSDRYSQHELFRESIVPYLETNRLRPRLLAIPKTRPIPYRAKVLGRALLAVRTDPNRFWMLLSGNAEVALSQSRTERQILSDIAPFVTQLASAAAEHPQAQETLRRGIRNLLLEVTSAAARNRPAATATATATATANVATGAAHPVATGPPAAHVAAPAAGQKRKARP
jgi:hypothetical protein